MYQYICTRGEYLQPVGAGTPSGAFYLLPYHYLYPCTRTRVVTHICMAGKGYRTGTGAVWPVESRGFTRALAYWQLSSCDRQDPTKGRWTYVIYDDLKAARLEPAAAHISIVS